ncbi:MAG: DUF423 domain-containing protein [Deltaproteobacteria bacterium]|nr:DUF423 domain-containing protein [Deltaproteobacteria bacterium]
MGERFAAIGAVSAFLGVAAGAFGAHGLRDRVPADLLAVWKTGAEYQLIHALALVLIGLFSISRPSGLSEAAGWAFVAGTVLFSGSLYLLALTGTRAFGAVTPLGGLCFLAGWALFAVAVLKR